MSFRICIEKESIKFSCSHFTIFGAHEAEALHGHNYYVTAEFSLKELDPAIGMAFDFNLLKPLLKEEVDALDEHILIPMNSPFLRIEKTADQIKVAHGKKSYAFPKDDVIELDVANITSEELARDFAKRIQKRLRENTQLTRIDRLSIGIQETRGQTVFYDLTL